MASGADESCDSGTESASSAALDRSKYTSPPPPPSSMTPPPSSQAPQPPPVAIVRTPELTHAQLSSPPPTSHTPLHHAGLNTATTMFSAEEVENADAPALRVMVDRLSVALNVANSAAAHHRLQYKLLFLESSEATKRMEVELEMTQREVEVLQQSSSTQLREPLEPLLITTPSSRPLDSSPTPATEDLLTTLRAHCRRVEHDNDLLQQRLREARNLILERESSFVEEAERLRQRIAENRQHMHLFRRSTSSEMPPISTASLPIPPVTPVRQRLATTEPASSKYSSKKSRTTEEPFAALLLAGSVLSQGPSVSTPQTPSRPSHKTSKQQYAAIPQTPLHARSTHADQYYASSARRPRLASSNQHDATPTPNPGSLRRRQSRDSTISAEDDDDDDAAHVQTPLRSRERASSVPRQHMPGTPTPTPGSKPKPKPQTSSQLALAFGTGGVQSRLYGPVGKPSASSAEKQKPTRGANDSETQSSLTTPETKSDTNTSLDAPVSTKRKLDDTKDEGHETRKPRTENQNTKAPLVEGVGLGIGGLA